MINCSNNNPALRLLRGVTRKVYITIVDGAGLAVDLTQADSVTVTLSLDGASNASVLRPEFEIGGADNNIISFTWYADQQKRPGRYTIDVTVDFGDRIMARVDWHRRFGVELVEHSDDVSYGEKPHLVLRGDVELTGNLVITTAGDSAMEEWILSPESEGYPKTQEGFFAWMRQPATDAAVIAEADHERADEDHEQAVADQEAAIRTVTVTVDDTTGTPSATATIADNNLALAFSGLKGESVEALSISEIDTIWNNSGN